MIRKIKLFCAFAAIAVLISSCATGKNRDTHAKLLGDLQSGNYKAMKDFVNDPKFYPEENSALLRLLERGSAEYLLGNLYQALKTFESAQKLSDELFTKSISKAAVAAVAGGSVDNYYGEKYERSLIRFYQSLIHYRLYKSGVYEAHTAPDGVKVAAKTLDNNEKRNHLVAARSILLEWDTLLNSYKGELAGKALYKQDLARNLYGAFIHEEFGTSEDKQIALGLYKNAKDVLLKNYNAYPSFNKKSKEFNDNFSKLASMPLEKVKAEFISPTINEEGLEKFIDEKIKKLSANDRDNVTVVLSAGLIMPKKAKRVVVAMLPGITVKDIKPEDVFIPVPVEVSAALAVIGGDLNTFLAWALALGAIEFEIPYINDYPGDQDWTVEAVLSGGSGEIKFPMVLLNPMTNIAVREFNDGQTARVATIAAKTAVLHAGALVAAYQVWQKAPKDNKLKEAAAKAAAVAAYKAATVAINKSLEADLRYWSILPNQIRFGSVKAPSGKYKLTFNSTRGGAMHVSQEVEVKDGENVFVDLWN